PRLARRLAVTMQRRLENEPTDVGKYDSSAHDSAGLRQLLARFASLFTGTVVVRAAAFAASVVVIRLVGPSEFGAFSVGLKLAVPTCCWSAPSCAVAVTCTPRRRC